MIRHIVFFTADADRVDAVRAGLSILADIPHARRLEVGTNVKSDRIGSDVDLVVYAEFDDEAALEAYRAHPLYQQSIDRVRPLRETRISADYDTATAVTAPIG